ncbi:MAG: SH3 domain-containing protein, partial [Caldilineae bacterium]
TTAPTPTPQQLPPIAPGFFSSGDRAVVTTPGATLKVRRSPGLSGTVIIGLFPGTEVLILSGPVELDGYTWWMVETEEVRGWVAGEFLSRP